MSQWASVRSMGCFLYFEQQLADRAALVRAMVDEVVERLDLTKTLRISTANNSLRWRKFNRMRVDEALADSKTRGITWMVGDPMDVRLAGALELRSMPGVEREFQGAPRAWLGAESERWPEAQFLEVARRWLRLAAEQGTPLSGGVLSASSLKDAKVEMTQIFESEPGEDLDRNPTPFHAGMRQERSYVHNWTKIRRVYPLTLLGPRFATQVDVSQLAAAHAVDIERVNESIIFGTGTPMLQVWSPQYLEATGPLRRLLWPLTAQNPADDPDTRETKSRAPGWPR